MKTTALSYAEKRDWLRLTRTTTVGPVAFASLLRRYGSAGEALAALPSLAKRKGLSIPDVHLVEAEMEASETLGIKIIASCEAEYPAYLRAVDPTPPIISVWGDAGILHRPCVAIVGSRNASAIGQRFAGSLARELGERGYSVISGLARGIDAAAHWGAIESGTAGVLGGGVDHVYPRQNAALFDAMRERGALVSESPLGYRAAARDFPRRNRIISGLCKGVVVIEAAERSGTLITARYAMEQNRDVMAAPGSPLDPRTKGCNRLIQNGAALIENVDDVINVMDAASLPAMLYEGDEDYAAPAFDWDAASGEIEAAKQSLLALLSPTPTPRDDLIRASNTPLPIAMAALMELEICGDIHVEPDGRISLMLSL